MSDPLNWNDADFHPATMEDDVIYIGTRKYVAADKLNATVIEQQAEIERLRELLGTVFSRHRAQIDEPLYTTIVMEIDQ